jgi:hypothetical protein
MPVALWERAVCLAATHGTCRIAMSVRLDYCSLCGRAETLATRSLEPSFLENPAGLVLAGSAHDAATPGVDAGHAETLIDIAFADGNQLRMRGWHWMPPASSQLSLGGDDPAHPYDADPGRG